VKTSDRDTIGQLIDPVTARPGDLVQTPTGEVSSLVRFDGRIAYLSNGEARPIDTLVEPGTLMDEAK
jgi:hypothetical protein